MASGDTVSGSVNIQKVQDDVLKLWSVVKALPEISSDQKNRIKSLCEAVVHSLHNNPDPSPRTLRSRRSSPSSFDTKLLASLRSLRFLQIKRPYCT
jgi:fatty acid synthase subunit alpha, fungi type